MKFFVNNIGRSTALTRGNTLWTITKPQYFRSFDADPEKRDSGQRTIELSKVLHEFTHHQQQYGRTPEMNPQESVRYHLEATVRLTARPRRDVSSVSMPDREF